MDDTDYLVFIGTDTRNRGAVYIFTRNPRAADPELAWDLKLICANGSSSDFTPWPDPRGPSLRNYPIRQVYPEIVRTVTSKTLGPNRRKLIRST